MILKDTVLPYHSSCHKNQHQDYFNLCFLNEKSQSLWSYSILYTYTNVHILPVVTICQLKPALTVLYTSDKMVGRTGKGTDKCDTQNGSGVLYRILVDCTATSPSFWCLFCKHTHLFTTTISEVFLYPSATLILMTFWYPWDMYVQ